MSSIGLNNPISGSYTSNYGMFMYPQSRNLKSPYLGGPIKGFIPPPV